MLEPARTVKIFQRQSDPLQFSEGDHIFEEGEKGEVMYGILEGNVDLQVNGQIVEAMQTGDVFGEGALVQPSGVRASTAIAKTSCTLAYIDEKRFLFAIQNTPMFAIHVMRSYSSRLRELKHRL